MRRIAKSAFLFFIKCLNIFWPKKKLIIFYSSPDLSDNALAYFQYIRKNHSQWQTAWIIENIHYSRQVIMSEGLSDVTLVELGSMRAIYYSLIAKVQVDTHGAGYKKFKMNRFPIIISLWHGSPIKKIGKDIGSYPVCEQDILISGARYFEPFFRSALTSENSRIISTGYPRNDWLTGGLETKFELLKSDRPYVIWMPTYVVSKGSSLGKGGIFNDGEIRNGYISFLSMTDLHKVNHMLSKLGVDLLIKLHPYDILNRYDFSDTVDFEHVRIIKADDESMRGSRMYGMLRFSSGLITDYSSVIFDYIITGKPIGIDLEACSTYTREKYFDYDFSQLHSVPISNINELINFCQYVISAESNRLCQSDSKYVTYTKTTFSESVYNEQMSYIND